MTLAEKIKLMQMQKSGQTPTATLGSNVNKMNTSIFASTKTAMSQAVANPQNPQVTLKDNNDNVFSQLNMVSGNQQTTSKSELYENPENIECALLRESQFNSKQGWRKVVQTLV